jgi:uncharacterized protein YacL
MSDVLGGIALAGFWLAVLVFLIVSHRRLHPLRASPSSFWQVLLQAIVLIVLVVFFFRYVRA